MAGDYMGNVPFDYGGYTDAKFFFGHNGIEMGKRNASLVDVPEGLCVVNINPIGKIATYAQVKAFYDFAKIDTKGLLLDPWNNKKKIESSVNNRIAEITGDPNKDRIKLSIAIGPTQRTPAMEAFPYADLQGSTDLEGNPVADITLSGVYTLQTLPDTETFEPIYPNNGNITWDQIMGCYQGSISPTIKELRGYWDKVDDRDPSSLGAQPKKFWDPFFHSFIFNTEELFDIATEEMSKRAVFYNLACRVPNGPGTLHIARAVSLAQKQNIRNALGSPFGSPVASQTTDRRMRKKYRKTRRKNRKNRK
jgi:hypothetical protein